MSLLTTIAAQYNASFNGVAFWELDDGTRYPNDAPEKEERIELHHPGSDDNTIVRLGRVQRFFEVRGITSTANMADLQADRGTSATLVYHGGAPTARLLDLTPTKVSGFALYEFTATFML